MSIQPTEFVKKYAPWSNTKLDVAIMCPRKFYLQYHKKIKGAYTGPALLVGTVVHEALAFALRGVEVKEAFNMVTAPTEARQLTTNELEQILLYMPAAEKFVTRFNKYKTMHASYDPEIERKVAVDFEGKDAPYYSKSVMMRGGLDVYLAFKDDVTAAVIDHKTGKEHPFEHHAMQLDIYTLLLKAKLPQIRKIILGLNFLSTENILINPAKDVPPASVLAENMIKNLNEKTHEASLTTAPKPQTLCPWCAYYGTCENEPAEESLNGKESQARPDDSAKHT